MNGYPRIFNPGYQNVVNYNPARAPQVANLRPIAPPVNVQQLPHDNDSDDEEDDDNQPITLNLKAPLVIVGDGNICSSDPASLAKKVSEAISSALRHMAGDDAGGLPMINDRGVPRKIECTVEVETRIEGNRNVIGEEAVVMRFGHLARPEADEDVQEDEDPLAPAEPVRRAPIVKREVDDHGYPVGAQHANDLRNGVPNGQGIINQLNGAQQNPAPNGQAPHPDPMDAIYRDIDQYNHQQRQNGGAMNGLDFNRQISGVANIINGQAVGMNGQHMGMNGQLNGNNPANPQVIKSSPARGTPNGTPKTGAKRKSARIARGDDNPALPILNNGLGIQMPAPAEHGSDDLSAAVKRPRRN